MRKTKRANASKLAAAIHGAILQSLLLGEDPIIITKERLLNLIEILHRDELDKGWELVVNENGVLLVKKEVRPNANTGNARH